jgi:hypothetical protein
MRMNSDKAMEMVAAIDEAMRQYDKCRTIWMDKMGSDVGFNEWFTEQIFADIRRKESHGLSHLT